MIRLLGNPEKAFRKLQERFPKETKKAYAKINAEAKGIVKRAIQNPNTWPLSLRELDRETIITRRSRGNPSSKIGGKLGTKIRAYYKSNSFYIGWPEYMRKYSDIFQTRENRKREPREIEFFQRRNIKNPNKSYRRPARQVWSRLAGNRKFQNRLAEIIRKRLKELRRVR
jgi:hypothetical protein